VAPHNQHCGRLHKGNPGWWVFVVGRLPYLPLKPKKHFLYVFSYILTVDMVSDVVEEFWWRCLGPSSRLGIHLGTFGSRASVGRCLRLDKAPKTSSRPWAGASPNVCRRKIHDVVFPGNAGTDVLRVRTRVMRMLIGLRPHVRGSASSVSALPQMTCGASTAALASALRAPGRHGAYSGVEIATDLSVTRDSTHCI
jgi:hypothetical protein